MKVKNAIKKVGAVAGSALMVGMTMGAAQTLGDFPQPFVTEDGQVQSQIVVGSGGSQADVVGAINVAASLGQAAVQTETRTETVATGGTASFGWTASAGGQTLDTVNDQLFFNDNLDTVRSTLTGQDVDSLAEVTFEDAGGTTTDIETFLYPNSNQVQFGQPQDRNNQDPVLYTTATANPSSSNGNYLFRLQANFEDTLNFTSDDVQDEEITLFGNTYTVSTNSDGNSLVLFGSQVTEDLNTGESTTVTIEGTELTIEAVSASDTDTGAFRVNGDLYERDEEGTVTVSGKTVRLDEVIVTNSNNNDGVLQFAIGSQEFTFEDGSKVQDDNGDAIDGTEVQFSGSDSDGGGSGDIVDELDSIDLYIGSEDDDMEYVTPAENDGVYSHPNFEDFEFHLGGLNPDTAAGPGENVGEVTVSPAGEDSAEVSFTDDAGNEVTVDFAYNQTGTTTLADNDGDTIHVVENATVMENEYFMSDAGDFPHLWEVTNIDYSNNSGEATLDLQDVVSGDQVEVDVDRTGSNADNSFNGSEVIDGQTYYFHVPAFTSAATNVSATWGTSSGVNDYGDAVTVFPSIDLDSGAGLSFTTNASATPPAAGNTLDIEFPSTESTDAQTVTVTGESNGAGLDGGSQDVTAGNTTYHITNNTKTSFSVAPKYGATAFSNPAVQVVEPEDDNDNENSYLVDATATNSDTEVRTRQIDGYSGVTRSTNSLESDSDVTAGYDFWGTHTLEDSDGQGEVTFHVPNGQATVGAAFTPVGGSLTAGGGGGTGSVTYTALAGQGSIPDMAMLDSDVTDSVRSSQHLILVGGPAVNTLVADLAEDNDNVWSAQEWRSQSSAGNARLNYVADAFATGQDALVVAGFAADDTRGAARYIANYQDNQANLQGANEVALTSSQYPNAQ